MKQPRSKEFVEDEVLANMVQHFIQTGEFLPHYTAIKEYHYVPEWAWWFFDLTCDRYQEYYQRGMCPTDFGVEDGWVLPNGIKLIMGRDSVD